MPNNKLTEEDIEIACTCDIECKEYGYFDMIRRRGRRGLNHRNLSECSNCKKPVLLWAGKRHTVEQIQYLEDLDIN